MANTITNEVTKLVEGKLKSMYSSLKVVSEVMGIELPSNEEVFSSETRKVIEGHSKAFEDV